MAKTLTLDINLFSSFVNVMDTLACYHFLLLLVALALFWKKTTRKYTNINNSPFHLKKQVMDQCFVSTMTYGCQTWSLKKQLTNKLRTAQRAMERKMLDLELQDKIPYSEIRQRTKLTDIIEYTLKQKWRWAGYVARMKNNRWTKRCTEGQSRRGKRSRGRLSRRWQDDITRKEGTTWTRKATDRRQWKTLVEGYILQWMDKA